MDRALIARIDLGRLTFQEIAKRAQEHGYRISASLVHKVYFGDIEPSSYQRRGILKALEKK